MNKKLSAYIKRMNESGRCPICGGDIGGMLFIPGNNANPLFDGRCCDACNYRFVVPARITYHENQMESYESIKSFADRLTLLTCDFLQFADDCRHSAEGGNDNE